MLSGPSFRSPLVFSVNSLILSDFPLTSFHLAEASLSAFLWLFTFECAVSKNITKCLLSIAASDNLQVLLDLLIV